MRRLCNVLLAGMAYSLLTLSVHASDLKVEAWLIWGANDGRETVKFEPAGQDLADKLHRMFKWQNYYEITNKTASIPIYQSRDLRMSAQCTIRVKNLGSSRVEVSCIGKGKQVHKGDYTLEPPKWLVLGGNGTNNTAWFIGLRAVDKNTAPPVVARGN